jgi:hypothetical protein
MSQPVLSKLPVDLERPYPNTELPYFSILTIFLNLRHLLRCRIRITAVAVTAVETAMTLQDSWVLLHRLQEPLAKLQRPYFGRNFTHLPTNKTI